MVTNRPARGDAFDPDCPTRVVLDRIGDKWTALVIGALVDGPLRFSVLRARIGGVAPKVLTQTLRAMERDGLLTRTVHAQVPPRVDYELTELGASLTGPIAALTDWAETHLSRILASRDDYDAAAEAR
ncbi:helix-turn-helix domain-containing protein [Nocardioides sp. S-58]|uniref:Helix-turn-helix domain-containing protein n=1 Tax=Nocardioides renjunii TaxID=3095075 RepID=A0ABU5KDI9_9ACTN|nr:MULTISPECIES: helix-turn-helix domain-containing protein [unclassified Nocardioides]MDZ5662914.1 helix-turn-helix domain-containing protein [Nocardioides sp. S-58]WQQ23212.1 helix-turn-helix domain-containing protein [Nocardioides sp. S-34]